MADPTITGNFGGENFQFTLNGVSTQKQMDRLIELTQAMAKKTGANTGTANKANKELEDHLDNLKELNKQETKQIQQNKEVKESWEDLVNVGSKLRYGWQGAIKDLGGWQTAVTATTGFVVRNLTNYADAISGALKMGVSGSLMDFAVASKTAGVSMGTFTKALAETGGGFASLGRGATDGAKYFGSLVSSVRSATASVGNLGMTNDEMAMFTAQQTKVAISQGFKGKAAQDAVIRNSQSLGKELDDLANRTGKNVLEMAAAAAKLAGDPIVSTFVKSAQAGSQKVSEAVNSFAAGLTAQFGEKGAKVAEDALKSALGGLPFAVTQTGKNLIMSSQATYYELERQAAKAKRGDKITEEDRKRLNDTVLQEVAARGDQLRMMAQLEGPAGESARQILEMAKEAEFYNSEEGRKRREQDKSAQQFNTSIRQFQANLQALAIPFLNLINGIDWTLFIDVVSGAIKVLQILLTPLTLLGKVIGDTGVGTVIGGLGALALVFFQGKAAFELLVDVVKKVTGSLKTITSGFGVSVATGTPINKNQAIIDRARQANKPVIDRANELYQGYGGKVDRAEALRQARKEHLASMGTGMEGQRRREEYIRSQAEGQKAYEAMKNPAAPSPTETRLSKASALVEKFAGAITGATAALAGSALAMWGESRLREDENDLLGKTLVYGGKFLEFMGVFGGLLVQFAPAIASAVTGMWAQVVANGGVSASLIMLANSAKLAALDLFKLGKSGFGSLLGSLSKGLGSGLKLLSGILPSLTTVLGVVRTGFQILSGPIGWLIGGATLLYTFWDDIVDVSKSLWNAISDMGSWFVDLGSKLWDGLTSMLGKAWDVITSPFTMLTDWFKNSWLGKMFGSGSSTASTTSSSTTTLSTGAGDVTARSAYPTSTNNSGYSKELVNTQTNAIDQNRLKESESSSLQRKQIALLEDISGTNSAQLGVQSRTAGNQDNSTRYLKTISMNGPAA